MGDITILLYQEW